MTITIESLAAKVREMRDAQRKYFKQRGPTWLAQSKRLEQEVDDLLSRIPESPKPSQQQLF